MAGRYMHKDPALRAPVTKTTLDRVSKTFERLYIEPFATPLWKLSQTTDIICLSHLQRKGVEAPQFQCVSYKTVEGVVEHPSFVPFIQCGRDLGISLFDALNGYTANLDEKNMIARAIRGARIGVKWPNRKPTTFRIPEYFCDDDIIKSIAEGFADYMALLSKRDRTVLPVSGTTPRVPWESDWAAIFEYEQVSYENVYVLGVFCITNKTLEHIWQLAVSVHNPALDAERFSLFVRDDLCTELAGIALGTAQHAHADTSGIFGSFANMDRQTDVSSRLGSDGFYRASTPAFVDDGAESFTGAWQEETPFLCAALEHVTLDPPAGSSDSK